MIPAIHDINQNQSVQIGSTIDPFNGITVTDGNDYLSNTTLTISLLDQNGNASDNNGYLKLNDDGNGDTMTEVSSGVYVLTDTQAPNPSRSLDFFSHQLPALQFIPTNAATTTIKMTENDKYGETTSASISVNASGSGSPAAATTTNASAVVVGSTGDATENGAVGAGQVDTVANDSMLTLNDPKDFAGKVDFKSGLLDLNGLTSADSYTFKNDMLSIYANGKLLDSVAFTGDSAGSFAVDKTITSGTISVHTWDDTRHDGYVNALRNNT